LVNCTVTQNTASLGTGGVFIYKNPVDAQRVRILNSILWGNSDASVGDPDPDLESMQLCVVAPSNAVWVRNSCVQGLTLYGASFFWENIASDPQFRNLGTRDLRLAVGSPAADWGRTLHLLGDFADLDRDADAVEVASRDRGLSLRVGRDPSAPKSNPCARPRVDIGAFETIDCDGDGAEDGVLVDSNDDGIADPCQDCDADGVPDPVEIQLAVETDCNGNGIPDGCDIASFCSTDGDEDGTPDGCGCRFDMVFLIDTSSSMQPDASAIESMIASVIGSMGQRLGRYEIVGIASNSGAPVPAPWAPWVTAWSLDLVGAGVPPGMKPENQEDWGRAVAMLSTLYEWNSPNRAIVLLTDEGANDGNPCCCALCPSIDPGCEPAPFPDDIDADLAAAEAAAADVRVYAIRGVGVDPDAADCVERLLTRVAAASDGDYFAAANPPGPDYESIGESIRATLVRRLPECPEVECLGDFNGDGAVSALDIAALLSDWGLPGGDLNGDATTNAPDLATLLSNWGVCGTNLRTPQSYTEQGGDLEQPSFLTIFGRLQSLSAEEVIEWAESNL